MPPHGWRCQQLADCHYHDSKASSKHDEGYRLIRNNHRNGSSGKDSNQVDNEANELAPESNNARLSSSLERILVDDSTL